MPSEILNKARAYEAEHGAAISPAERPAYHMTPYVGWLNDPNGFSYYKGRYHQFYQYNPYDVRWAPMHWGHAVSTDLLHWEYLPCALAPDSPADNGPGCFSGSATEMDDGKQLLMYTSVIAEKQPNGEMRDIQTQSIAIGDGLNYEKPACNPVLTQKDLPEGFSRFDFRDPKIWREADGTYSAVTVCLAEDGSGAAALFQSKDGFDWHFVTVLERCNNQYGKMWECPDFFPLDGKQVLMLGPMEMLPKGEFHNGHNVIAFIGSYDQATHTFTKENVQLMDGGIDFYATQTTLAPDGRRIMTAWLQTWSDTEDKPKGCKWFGQTICPRELHIKPGRAVQRAERQLLYGGRHLEGEHLFLVIIAEKMFPEYGRDELFLSQTERIALNACFEAVRIEVAGKVELNRSGSARSKVGRSIPQGDFHSGDGGGRGVRVVRMCFFRIGVGFLLWQHVCNRLLRCGIFLTEKFEDIVDITEFRTDFLIGETLAAGVGEMGFEIV